MQVRVLSWALKTAEEIPPFLFYAIVAPNKKGRFGLNTKSAFAFIVSRLVKRVGCHEAILGAEFLLVCLEVSKCNIAHDVVVLL